MPAKISINNVKTFYSALRSDIAGNTLAMVAAGLVPLAGIIGSGVDMSRAYMVKTRLQQACDAGVLAGRRAMGDGSYNSSAQTQTSNFFDANFPDGYINTKNKTFTATNPTGTSAVVGSAEVEYPTVIMKMFGSPGIKVAVSCQAVLEISNSDITMVLDTTGSMNFSIDDGAGGTTTRIDALQTATKSFYDIVDSAATGTGARIRYAMVPYTGTVNIGEELYNLDPTYLIGGSSGDTHPYQSRRAWYEYEDTETTVIPAGTVTETYEQLQYVGNNSCNTFGNNNNAVTVYGRNAGGFYYVDYTWYPSHFGYSNGDPATKSGDPDATYTFDRTGFTDFPNYICTRRATRTTTAPTTETTTVTKYTLDPTVPGATFSYWEHTQIDLPVDGYVSSIAKDSGGSYINSAVTLPFQVSASPTRWGGCIHERDTIASDNVVYNSSSEMITPGATKDLDIDAAPTNDATRWRPYWPEATYFRDAGNATQTYSSSTNKSQVSCPLKAKLFSTMTETEFDNYVDALVADGGTYHDMGMLWGARVSSPEGIFQTNVTEAATNNGYVSRHLIFFTDGQLDIGDNYHSAYGVERHNGFIGGGIEATASQNHKERFLALCDATKAKGIRVWVIAFATSLSSEMSNCASANSAFTSTNASSLNDTFTTIAQTVADLRLSQ